MVEPIVESSTETVLNVARTRTIKVLHVDDDQAFLKVAKQCLDTQGEFEVDAASSVNEALEKLKETDYDAVVSDYQMPGKDGLEFLKELREKGNTVPFIVFTGKGREEIAIKALNLGADLYVDKHGDPETVYYELAHCLRSAVRKHAAEVQARETVQKLEAIYQNAIEGIGDVSPEENFVYANKAFADILGCQENRLVGMNLRRFVDDEGWAKIKAETERRRQGEASRYELVFYRTDGTARNVVVSASPLSGSDGSFAGTVGIVLDITGRKKTEEELRRFSTAVRTSLDGIITGDLNGNITDVNDAVLRTYGGTNKGDLLGKNVLDFLAESDRTRALQDSMESLRTGQGKTIEYRALTKNGTEIPIEITTAFMRDEQGEPIGFVDIVRNTAERKKAEEQIRDSEEQLSQLFMRMPSGVAVYRAVNNGEDFAITDFNEAAERIEHVSRREIIGKCVTEVFPGVKDFGVFEVFQRVWRTGQSEYFPAALYKDDKDQGTWRESWIYKLPNGSIVAIYNDITQRKKAEEKLKENSERIEMMNEKLRVVGSLTKHDVRNKLSAVTGYAYLLKKKHADQADIVDGLGKMEQAVKEVGKIFGFARTYEQLGVEELTYADAEKVVNEAVALFSGLTFKVVNGCHGLTVLADSFLRQLFYNFIDNTRKYGGKATAARVYYEKAELDGLRLVYEDDGAGISAENKLKLFTEGFSTGDGAGFGLFLIRKMMDVYGWTIQETGKQGKGAQFTITISRTNKEGKENYQLS